MILVGVIGGTIAYGISRLFLGPIILSVASGAHGALGRGPKSSIDRRSPCGRPGTNLTRRGPSESQLWARCIKQQHGVPKEESMARSSRGASFENSPLPASRMVMVVNLAGALLLS